MTEIELLKKLEGLGVTFCVPVPSQWGRKNHIATIEQLLVFLEDPTSLYAEHYGVSKDEYHAWENERYAARCSGKTSRGSRCKNAVQGGSNVDPRRWVDLQGEYCVVHGG